jgi:hypothetical protein
MLQPGTRGLPSRRSRIQTAVGLVALAAATVAFSGCLNDTPHISETCTTPASMADGFIANRTVTYRVATQTSPTDPKTTWICEDVEVSGAASQARRIAVKADAGATVGQVTTDSNSRACASGVNNTVPPPHPIESATVNDLSVYLDAYTNGANTAWLCLEAGTLKQRVVVNTPTATTPTVVVNDDPTPSPLQDTTPPPLGKPSSSCYAGTYGAADELLNLHADTRDLFLYTAQPSDTEVHICARLSSGQNAGGVHLGVNAAADQIVRIDTSTDLTPCTQNVVTTSNPPESIKTSPPGQSPPSVCVNGTRYAIIAGPVPPVVDLDLDQ